jgi:hypothetical protein
MFRIAAFSGGLTVPTQIEVLLADRGGAPFVIDWLAPKGENLLRVEARPEQAALVLNSYLGGCWGRELVVRPYPFGTAASGRSTLRFEVGRRQFEIIVDDHHIGSFPHRADPARVTDVVSTIPLLHRRRTRRALGRWFEYSAFEQAEDLHFVAAAEPVVKTSRDTLGWLARTHTEWQSQLGPIRPADAFMRCPSLSTRHLHNCRVLPDRLDMLECLPSGGVVAELGTREGSFASSIWSVCRPRELHLFDLSFEAFRKRGALPSSEGLHIHEGDSSTELARFDDGYFDWIYIDADHSFEGASRDVAVAKRKIKPDGILAFDDYILWSHVEFMPYGVAQVVNRLCVEEDWEIVFLCLESTFYFKVALRRIRRA